MKHADRTNREASCEGKQAMTEKVARAIVKKRHMDANAYRCAHCGAWHIGSQLRRRLPKSTREYRRAA